MEYSWKFMHHNSTSDSTRQLPANARPLSSTSYQKRSTISTLAKCNHARFRMWLGYWWTRAAPKNNMEKSRRVYDKASIKSTSVEWSVTSSPASYYYDAINCEDLEYQVKAVIEYRCENSRGPGWDTQTKVFEEINPHAPNLFNPGVETVQADCEVNKVLENCFEENWLPTLEEAAVEKWPNIVNEVKSSEQPVIGDEKSFKGLMLKEDIDNECTVHVSWEKGEIEWRRTLACKLFEERHNVGRSERMDSLWEAFEIDSNKQTENKKTKKGSKNKATNDDDDDDGGHGDQLCCLQIIKSSTAGGMNFVKISKALKLIRWLHYVTYKHARN